MSTVNSTTVNDPTAVAATAAIVCHRFAVIGMTCSHCEHAITTEVGRLPGVTAAVADAAAGIVTVQCDRELDVAEIAAAIDEAGYELAR